MPTLSLFETSVVASGRKMNIDSVNGEFWATVNGLPDECYNTLVTQYNALEDAIDADPETLGTKSDGSTFKIGSSPSRPRPVTR